MSLPRVPLLHCQKAEQNARQTQSAPRVLSPALSDGQASIF